MSDSTASALQTTTTIPRKIGRYDVLGHLASGGMAEIFLGRLTGPSGFERPLVIKRILPNLAREEAFVSMFLDEAKIVAGIRHPNVVHVQELGHDAGELFLVMEYLEGESAAGLVRRSRAQGHEIGHALCAYIMAEACAGLHAAHELVDGSGNKKNVVHRDVSPQNVFITYSGQVKVLDFGVATAADRITKTEAGQFKGKFEYASPEQCRGFPVDRRSDVFALGIVLYELSTGTRLFKRQGSLDTLRAICESPIVPPTAVVKDFPPALSALIMRALERDKDRRYQTALEMRRELLGAMRTLSTDVAPEESLAKLMTELFGERIALKQEMLRSVQMGGGLTDMPSAETDTTIEIPVAYEDAPMATAPLGPPFVQAPAPSASGPVSVPQFVVPQARSNYTPLVVLAVITALVTCVGGLLFMLIKKPRVESSPVTEDSAVVAVIARPPASGAATGSATADSKQGNDGTAVAAEVTLRIDTVPPGAHVLLQGVDKGVSPLELRVPKGTEEVAFELRRDGYLPSKERVVPDVDQRLRLPLTAIPQKVTQPAAVTSHKPAFGRFD